MTKTKCKLQNHTLTHLCGRMLLLPLLLLACIRSREHMLTWTAQSIPDNKKKLIKNQNSFGFSLSKQKKLELNPMMKRFSSLNVDVLSKCFSMQISSKMCFLTVERHGFLWSLGFGRNYNYCLSYWLDSNFLPWWLTCRQWGHLLQSSQESSSNNGSTVQRISIGL